MKITNPGTYEAKNSSFLEFVKIILWGSGFPFGLIGILALIIGLLMEIKKCE